MTMQMKTKQNIIEVVVYSTSSIQNINNRRLRIWKNKRIIEFNKQPARYICTLKIHMKLNANLMNKKESTGLKNFNDLKAN